MTLDEAVKVLNEMQHLGADDWKVTAIEFSDGTYSHVASRMLSGWGIDGDAAVELAKDMELTSAAGGSGRGGTKSYE